MAQFTSCQLSFPLTSTECIPEPHSALLARSKGVIASFLFLTYYGLDLQNEKVLVQSLMVVSSLSGSVRLLLLIDDSYVWEGCDCILGIECLFLFLCFLFWMPWKNTWWKRTLLESSCIKTSNWIWDIGWICAHPMCVWEVHYSLSFCIEKNEFTQSGNLFYMVLVCTGKVTCE